MHFLQKHFWIIGLGLMIAFIPVIGDEDQQMLTIQLNKNNNLNKDYVLYPYAILESLHFLALGAQDNTFDILSKHIQGLRPYHTQHKINTNIEISAPTNLQSYLRSYSDIKQISSPTLPISSTSDQINKNTENTRIEKIYSKINPFRNNIHDDINAADKADTINNKGKSQPSNNVLGFQIEANYDYNIGSLYTQADRQYLLLKGKFPILNQDSRFQIVKLPCHGTMCLMMILPIDLQIMDFTLPKSTAPINLKNTPNIEKYIRTLNLSKWQELLHNTNYNIAPLSVKLTRYQAHQRQLLNDIMSRSGLALLFAPPADFSGFGGDNNLRLGNINQDFRFTLKAVDTASGNISGRVINSDYGLILYDSTTEDILMLAKVSGK